MPPEPERGPPRSSPAKGTCLAARREEHETPCHALLHHELYVELRRHKMKACGGHGNERAESHTGLVENEPILLNPHLECSNSPIRSIRVLLCVCGCVGFQCSSQRGRIDLYFADPQKVQHRPPIRLPICGGYI